MKSDKASVMTALFVIVVSTVAFSLSPAIGFSTVLKEEKYSPAASIQGAFAYVSQFTSGGTYSDYGWHLIGGSPVITTAVSYFGEPSLELGAGSAVSTNENVTTGEQLVSFQFAVNTAAGNGTFSIMGQSGNILAYITVNGSNVYVGAAGNQVVLTGTSPSNSAYPSGWTYISGNLYNTSTNKQFSWTMQVFVDQTLNVFATIGAPQGYSYNGLELSSTYGNVYFTNIVFSSYEIPIYLPGYNNMEGYGQGSGLLVSLLQPFTILHANMVLDNWTIPQNGILSFQINAMNYYGATRSSCVGFFQLGVDLDPNGTIAPWYVEGTNCFAHYFLNSNNPAVQPGFATPNGSELGLTIQDVPTMKEIMFQIIDYSVSGQNRFWNASMPYSGSAFYATYTQLEFQPVAESQILNYHFHGSLYNMTYGSSWSGMTMLNNSYMLPFTLDAPPTWSLTYYNGQYARYNQIA